MGEAILAAALVQMGAVLAVWLIADTIATLARSEPLAGIWFIVLAFLAATACIATGTWRLLKLMLQESTTAERRSAFVGQAMALQRKLRARQANRMPNIPEPKDFGTQRGRKLSYRLPNSGRDAYRVLYWGLASLLLSMVSSGVLAVTLNRWTWTLGSIALSIASIILLVLVGVSIWWFVKQLLAWFRCGPTGIELSQFPLIPGTKAEVLLSQSGRMRLRNLEFSLECVEIAVYQQGTDARREVTIVDEIPIHTEPRLILPLVALGKNCVSWKFRKTRCTRLLPRATRFSGVWLCGQRASIARACRAKLPSSFSQSRPTFRDGP